MPILDEANLMAADSLVQYLPLLMLAVAGLISLAAAGVAFRRPGGHGARWLGVLMVAVAEWELTSVAGALAPDLTSKLLWAKVQYLGITSVAPVWLLFCMRYAHRARVGRRHALVFALPLVVLGFVATNEAHHLIWQNVELAPGGAGTRAVFSYGPIFWVAAAYNYVLLGIGSTLVLAAQARRHARFRGQTAALLVGVAAPLLTNAVYLTRLVPIDITPFGFSISAIVCWTSLFRLSLLNLAPIARDVAFLSMPDAALALDPTGRIVDANPAAGRILDASADSLIGRHIGALLPTLETNAPHLSLRRPDGSERKCRVDVAPLREHDEQLGDLLVLRDETDTFEAHEQLVNQRDFAQQVMDAMGQGLIVTNGRGRVEYVNSRLAEMLRIPSATILGRPFVELVVEEDLPGIVARRADRRARMRTEYEVRLIDVDGRALPVLLTHVSRDQHGEYAGGILVVTDLTARKQLEETLLHRAQHDPLTGLPNRRMLQARLDQALHSRPVGTSAMALLLLDLDGFKQVNDTLGHLAGDTLLKQVTERWSTLVRAEDTLARLGGDEFALFLPREGDPTRAGRIAERLVQVTNAPFIIDGHAVVVGVSIGVAIATDEHPDATELLRWADGAMYDAKRRRSSWSVYTTELDKPTGTPAESQRILTFPDPFRLTRIEA